MTATDFSAVQHLGELDPSYFEELIEHKRTKVAIIHDGRTLYRGGFDVTRPRMSEMFGEKRAVFDVDLQTESREPDDPLVGIEDEIDPEDADESDNDESTAANEDEPPAEDTEQDDGDSEEDEDRISFSLSEGPSG